MTSEFQELSTEDNSGTRRTSGVHLFDPESLLTGAEIAAGLGYLDKRQYPSDEVYQKICAGEIPQAEIPTLAPRVRSTLADRLALIGVDSSGNSSKVGSPERYNELLETAA